MLHGFDSQCDLHYLPTLGATFVCQTTFHQLRLYEGIGIREGDMFDNPITIELQTLQSEVLNLPKSMSMFFLLKMFLC